MTTLRVLRDKWVNIEPEETQLLRSMPIVDGLRDFAALYVMHAEQLADNNVLYWSEHEAALIERQRRLTRLARWLRAHSEAAP